jgi:triosephosphate isomerase
MYKTQPEARDLARSILQGVAPDCRAEVALAPPYTALAAVAAEVAGSKVRLAAQDCHFKREGAFTGAISPWMLKDAGCHYVIIGHSERRQHFGDTDWTVNFKVKAAMEAGLNVILCIGETIEQREAGVTLPVVGSQIGIGLNQVAAAPENLVIAYEPVWAIGTGKTATPEQAQEVHEFIRAEIERLYGQAGAFRILYGGSVTPDNAAALLGQPDLDGALVGGASLKPDSFLKIIAAA